MSYLRRPSTVSWETLRAQFGSELADTKQGRGQFRRDFAKHLREVLLVYREANVETTDVGVTLLPSRTHVPLKGLRDMSRTPFELEPAAAGQMLAR